MAFCSEPKEKTLFWIEKYKGFIPYLSLPNNNSFFLLSQRAKANMPLNFRSASLPQCINAFKNTHPELKVNYSVLISQEQNEQSTISSAGNLIPKQFHRASQLNSRYTFSNFIEGKGNQFAKAAASSVADGPGQTPFNPLVIYSNPGLGKTHLIQAIGNHILKTQPKMKVIYATSEKFMLDFINSIQKFGQMAAFTLR